MKFLFAVLFVFSSVALAKAPKINSKRFCQTAADCVADTCCHLKGAVNKKNAPKCDKSNVCTQECGKFDCGKGEILCEKNQCVVKEKSLGM